MQTDPTIVCQNCVYCEPTPPPPNKGQCHNEPESVPVSDITTYWCGNFTRKVTDG